MSFPFRLVAFDLDGTTLQLKTQTLSNATIDAMTRAREAGAAICVATGRPLPRIPQQVVRQPFLSYAVSANGALLHDLRDNTLLRAIPIEQAQALALLRQFQKWRLPYQLGFSDQTVIGICDVYKTLRRMQSFHQDTTLRTLRRVLQYFHVSLSPVRLLQRHEAPLIKLAAYCPTQKSCEEKMAYLRENYQMEVVTTSGLDIELTMPGATKGEGIAYLAEREGIAREEIIVFGDSGNDESMRPFAGCFVSMGTAEEGIRSIADIVTGSVEEDGVAAVLNRFLQAEGL